MLAEWLNEQHYNYNNNIYMMKNKSLREEFEKAI